jgi:tetratricopeptide (TPR) repeat protein
MIPLTRIGVLISIVAVLVSCGAVADPVNPNVPAVENHYPSDMFLNSEELIIANGTSKEFQNNILRLHEDIASVLDGINKKYPDLITDLIGFVEKKNRYIKETEEAKHNSSPDITRLDVTDLDDIKKSFKNLHPAEVYSSIFEYGTQASMRVLSSNLPVSRDSVSAMLKICYLINELFSDEFSKESKFNLFYSLAALQQLQFDLKYANSLLSAAEEIVIQSGGDDVLIQGLFMTRGINNYFLGNYAAAVSNFESAPEYYDEKNEWFVYNKLNLYLSYLAFDKARAEKMIKEFLSKDFPEDIKKSWPYRILQSIDSDRPSDIIKKARDGAKNEREVAERLCEAYYYVGMKYYHLGLTETARLYFILSKAQNVYEFLEHLFSDLALHFYFKY